MKQTNSFTIIYGVRVDSFTMTYFEIMDTSVATVGSMPNITYLNDIVRA